MTGRVGAGGLVSTVGKLVSAVVAVRQRRRSHGPGHAVGDELGYRGPGVLADGRVTCGSVEVSVTRTPSGSAWMAMWMSAWCLKISRKSGSPWQIRC
jgi:hypothetical protein